MKVFITKYALTQGIFEAEGRESSFPEIIRVGRMAMYHKGEWFLTLPEAEAKRDEMIEQKRKSLLKQLAGLEAKRTLPVRLLQEGTP